MAVPPRVSRFRSLDAARARALADEFGSPLFLIDLPGLRARFREFSEATRSCYPHSEVALSYKTSPLPAVLRRLHADGARAEAVSAYEIELARRLSVPAQNTVFNGPLKSDSALYEALGTGMLVHCDHLDEVQRAEAQARSLGQSCPIGIRVRFRDESTWNRFGFEVAEPLSDCAAGACIDFIQRSPWLVLAGLHVQIGTNIRDLAVFERMATRLAALAEALRERWGVRLRWLDVGGGLAGISPTVSEAAVGEHPCPPAGAYAQAVTGPLHEYLESLSEPPRLIFEPGRALFEPFGAVLMSVVGRRPATEGGLPGLIVDAGLSAVTDCERFAHPVHCPDAGQGSAGPVTLFGPSCRQRDVLRQSVSLPPAAPGDRLVMYGTGAYAMASSHSFIHPRPGVVGWSADDRFVQLRRPDTLEHSMRLEVET